MSAYSTFSCRIHLGFFVVFLHDQWRMRTTFGVAISFVGIWDHVCGHWLIMDLAQWVASSSEDILIISVPWVYLGLIFSQWGSEVFHTCEQCWNGSLHRIGSDVFTPGMWIVPQLGMSLMFHLFPCRLGFS